MNVIGRIGLKLSLCVQELICKSEVKTLVLVSHKHLKLDENLIPHVPSTTHFNNMDYDSIRLPKLIAFDLDGTIWTPDMYQLWGGGAPFRHAPNRVDLLDSSGATVRLLGSAAQILHDIQTHPRFIERNTKVAWVSCTDEPEWAEECLHKFATAGNVPLASVVHSSQIYKANKSHHFRKLKEEFPSIEYTDMLFFDNERSNIVAVSKLGVRCVYAPHGMTEEAWRQGLDLFND